MRACSRRAPVIEVQSSLRGSLLAVVNVLIARRPRLERAHRVRPVQFWMIDAQAGSQLVHVVAKGNPLPQQRGIINPGQR